MHAFVHVTMLLIIACYFPFTLSAPRPRPNPQDEAAIAPIKPIRLPLTRHSRPSNLTNRLVQVPGENGILARDAMPEQNREARAGAIDGPGGRGEAGFPTTNSSVLALMRTYVVPHVADQSFWFANLDVGDSKNLSLLVDTGSTDIFINPGGVYKPSPASKDLRESFGISFVTTRSDGTGAEMVRGKLFEDAVGFAGTPLSITNQTIGNVTNEFEPFQHDGIIGYGGPGWSATGRKSFFQNLCDAGKLPSCQFGMTLRHDGTGEQTLGGVDPRYASKLSVAPVAELGPWSIYGDVVVGNQVVARDQTMILDSGTTVVFGPIEQVRQIFKRLNLKTTYIRATQSRPSYLYGSYPCARPPISFGFDIPSAANASQAYQASLAQLSNPSRLRDRLPDDNDSSMSNANTNNGSSNSVEHMLPIKIPDPNNRSPEIGSSFDAPISYQSQRFVLESQAWSAGREESVEDGNILLIEGTRDDGNCTATLQGTDAFGNFWLVGQPWLQGRYVDHDFGRGAVGVVEEDVP